MSGGAQPRYNFPDKGKFGGCLRERSRAASEDGERRRQPRYNFPDKENLVNTATSSLPKEKPINAHCSSHGVFTDS